MDTQSIPKVKDLVKNELPQYTWFNKNQNIDKISKKKKALAKSVSWLQVSVVLILTALTVTGGIFLQKWMGVAPQAVGAISVGATLIWLFFLFFAFLATDGELFRSSITKVLNRFVNDKTMFSPKLAKYYTVQSNVNQDTGKIIVSLCKTVRKDGYWHDEHPAKIVRVEQWHFGEAEEVEATEMITALGSVASEANNQLHNQAIEVQTERSSLAKRIDHATSICQ